MIIDILFNDDYIIIKLGTSLTMRGGEALPQNYSFLLSDANASSTDFLLNNPTS